MTTATASATSLVGPLGVLAGAGMGVGIVLVVVGVRGTSPDGVDATWRTAVRGPVGRRGAIGGGTALLVLVLTRWVAVAAGVGLLAGCWSALFGGSRRAHASIDQLEALATWTESLRDMVATGIALPEALPTSTVAAAPPLQQHLLALVDRLRTREPVADALLRFADDLDDPAADLIVAALVLNARAQGRQLKAVLSAIARSARAELEVRRRIEAERRATRRGVQIVVAVTVVMALGLVFLNPVYVEPYRTVAGQVVLAVVVALFGSGFVWLRQLAEFRPPQRFLSSPVSVEVVR